MVSLTVRRARQETAFLMSSWAALLGTTPEVPVPTAQEQSEAEPVAIMDANAIISLGAAAASLAPVLASTEEAVAEIKDASSRAALSTLSITLRAPSEAAVRAVATFAARTGDLHQLSTEDVRLIALAYTYEAELYGTDHLRTEPVPVRVQGGKTAKQKLPGWGATDESWEAIDKVPDEGMLHVYDMLFYGDVLCSASLVMCRADAGVDTSTVTKSTAWVSTCTTPRTDQNAPDSTWEVARSSKNAQRRANRKVWHNLLSVAIW